MSNLLLKLKEIIHIQKKIINLLIEKFVINNSDKEKKRKEVNQKYKNFIFKEKLYTVRIF